MEEDLAPADQMIAPPSRLIRTDPDHASLCYLSTSATASANVESEVQAISGTLPDVTEPHQTVDDLRHTEYQHLLARDPVRSAAPRIPARAAGTGHPRGERTL